MTTQNPKELLEDELKKVTGGFTVEDRALGRIDDYPYFYPCTADGVEMSITNYQGELFDINENEYCWTSFENSIDGMSTTCYFTSVVGNNVYVKTITGADRIIPFLYSANYFIDL